MLDRYRLTQEYYIKIQESVSCLHISMDDNRYIESYMLIL